MSTEKLEKQLLEKCLPILNDAMKAEHAKIVETFHDVITSDNENSEFFKSPLNYMKSRGIITIDSFEFSDGETVEFYDDESIRNALKTSREMHKKDPNIISFPVDAVKWVAKNEVLAYADWKAVVCCTFSTKPEIIEKFDFGPLMNQATASKIKEYMGS